MVKKFGVGVIGVGFMGELHARVFAEMPNVKLLAVSDINAARAKEIAEKYGAESYYKNYKRLLERTDINTVVIASTLEDADDIIHATKRNDVKLTIGHILRFDTRISMLKTAIQSGSIGRPLTIYSRRNTSIHDPHHFKMGARVPVEVYLGVHDLDLYFWLLEDQAVSVFSQVVNGRVKEEFGFSDFCWIMVRFKNGALGVLECGWGLSENFGWFKQPQDWFGIGDSELEVIGTKGSVYANYFPMGMIACDGEGWKYPDTAFWPVMHGNVVGALKEQDSHFVKCIVEDKKPLVSGEDGRKSLEVALAAKKSYESDSVVKLPI